MMTAEITKKLESLSQEDYNMVVMLIERLSERPSNILSMAREKYVAENPMTMEEIDDEIQQYRREKRE